MFPEDRVLVAVINRRRDLAAARQGWYRIPTARHTWREVEYLAFFLSRAFGPDNGAVRWVAPVRGWELARRRDLLPAEADHPRADAIYFRIALGPLTGVDPPIVNGGAGGRARTITFIYTTGAAFTAAHTIRDLSGAGDYAVTRVYQGATFHAADYRRGDPDF